MMRFISLFILIFFTQVALASEEKILDIQEFILKKEKTPSQYAFSPQLINSCPFVNIMNFDLWQKYKDSNESVNYFTKKEWLEKNINAFLAIQDSELYLRKNSNEYKEIFVNALNGLGEKELYTENGEFIEENWTGSVEDLISLLGYAPYFTKEVPCVSTPLSVILPETVILSKIPTNQALNTVTYAGESHYVVSGTLDPGEKQTIHYSMGTYFKMLLYLGIGGEGENLKKGDPYFKLSSLIKESILNTNHPWNFLTRKNFFEYELMKIFEKDEDLFKKAQKVIDIGSLKPWWAYNESKKYFTKKGKKRSDVLPLKDLPIFAYDFSARLNSLWAASIGKSALQAVLELDENSSSEMQEKFDDLYDFMTAPKNYKAFIGVWHEIRETLSAEDYICFFGHGNVMTFALKKFNKIFGKQQYDHEELAQALGFMKIESLYYKEIHALYRYSN